VRNKGEKSYYLLLRHAVAKLELRGSHFARLLARALCGANKKIV
jgi:hypothetical protein